MRVETDKLFGEVLEYRLTFSAAERRILAEASRIAGEARHKFSLDEDSDTLLSEVEHGCRELLENERGLPVDISCGEKEGE